MENFTDDGSWGNNFNATSSIDVQEAHSNVTFWDPMVFADAEPAGAPDSQSFANSSIDNIIMTPQDFQSSASRNQEFSFNFDTETPSPNNLAPLEEVNKDIKKEVNKDIKKEVKELWDTLREIKRELVTVKGQFQMANSELYTIRSNHAQLLRWTLDMGATVKALLKWLAENIGANIVGQEGNQIEDLGSWLYPGSES